MRAPRHPFHALVTVLVAAALWLSAGVPTRAQAPSRRPLLRPVTGVLRDHPARGPRPRRERAAALHLDVFAAGDASTGAPAVDLNLFDDVDLVAQVEHYEPRGPASFLWHGRLQGIPQGHATFVSTDGIIAGTVFADGVTYEIAYAGDGVYDVKELDPAAFPTDDPPGQFDLVPAVQPDVVPSAAADTAAQIDVLVVWTPAAEAAAGGLNAMRSLVDLSVANANTAYANSGISTRLRLVYKTQVPYTESTISTDLSRLVTASDGYMDAVHGLRDQYGADIVSLLGSGYTSSSGACGVGYLMNYVSTSFASTAFNVVDYSCAAGNLSYAHEVGHNEGMHHDPANASGTGAYSYSYGYVDPACAFRTVMAYGGCPRVTQFSSPNATYGGKVTGTSTQNNALTLNNTAPTVANFRQAVAGACTYTLSGSSWAAPVGGGASTVGLSVSGTGCSWTATSNAAWLTVTSGASGSTSATIGFTAQPNGGTLARSATLSAAGRTLTVTQQAPCSYALSPGAVTAGPSGASPSVAVSAGTGCTWSAQSNAGWLSVTAGSSGSGSGTVTLAVAPNPSPAPRTASITAGGKAVTVTQSGQAAAVSPPTLTAPSGTVAVDAADDFALSVLQDRWDMNERTDLGWFTNSVDQPLSNLTSPTFAGGLFAATSSTSDPNVFLLETGNPNAARLGKTGSVYPIDADRYRRLNFRMCLPAGSTAQLYWSRGTIYSDNSTPNSFVVNAGCQVYSLDLRTWSLGRMPAVPGLQQYAWTGMMRSLRLDPTSAASQNVTLDWASITDVADAATFRTVTWSGASPVDIYLDSNNNASDGTLGLLWKDSALATNVTGGSYSFQFGALPPGDYYVGMRATGTSDPLVYSPGFYRVGGRPTLKVLSPSEEGSADDFATVQLGNAWDMQQAGDVERTANVTSPALATLNLETTAGATLSSQTVYRGTAAAGYADPILWMLWSGGRGRNYRIDTSRYRILTLEMGIAGPRDINAGSIARLVWKRADESVENVSDDIIVNHRQGVNSLDKIIVDMADRAALPLEAGAGSPSHSGWTGLVDSFRVDPHEFSDPRQFWVRRVKLAALERAAGAYTVRWRLDGVTDPTTRVAVYADTDNAGFNGTLVAQDLPYNNAGDGTGRFVWNLSGVTAGAYYLYVQATTPGGAVLNRQYARWPVIVGATAVAAPVLHLDRTILRYAATQNGAQKTGSQQVGVTFANGLTTWTATAVAPCDFVQISGRSGTGRGAFSVSMAPRTNYPAGATLACTVRVDAPGATNSPQFVDVSFTIYRNGTTRAPWGYIDTPSDNATVSGAFGVTGWALDDLQVSSITIWRDPLPGEPTYSNGKVFIGNAVTLEGARPDVEAANPTVPLNYKAGWGALVLSNQLPGGGNGPFRFYVYVSDPEGHQVLLGSRRIVCANASAIKPFGTIDTPGNGDTVSGTVYNFGWALTAQPNYIPTDGSTIWVFIDSVPVGHPVYNQYRSDIAKAFPGYANSNGAVGVFTIDTTKLANGLHTIAWSVADSAGNVEGIGSRFFRVSN